MRRRRSRPNRHRLPQRPPRHLTRRPCPLPGSTAGPRPSAAARPSPEGASPGTTASGRGRPRSVPAIWRGTQKSSLSFRPQGEIFFPRAGWEISPCGRNDTYREYGHGQGHGHGQGCGHGRQECAECELPSPRRRSVPDRNAGRSAFATQAGEEPTKNPGLAGAFWIARVASTEKRPQLVVPIEIIQFSFYLVTAVVTSGPRRLKTGFEPRTKPSFLTPGNRHCACKSARHPRGALPSHRQRLLGRFIFRAASMKRFRILMRYGTRLPEDFFGK